MAADKFLSGVMNYEERVKAIPELSQYSEKAVLKYVKLFGGFQFPDKLHKKEIRYLHKLTRKLEKQEKNTRRKNEVKKVDKRQLYKKMDSSRCKQRIVIDLSYFQDDLMKYSDLRNCVMQVKRCYSTNRLLPEPLKLHITGLKDIATKTFQNLFRDEYKKWDVFWHEDFYGNLFDKKDIVYLTSDSENILESLDDSKVYVIGGILDHNSLKGLSYSRAIKENVSHARLPIDKYFDMKTLKVLTINQVFSVISSVANEIPWDKALKDNIPQRKEAVPKKIIAEN
ncbi:UNVERIFIED_CONTAM: hypothetical protein RMT77_010419 [Armadillidium vulgare]